MPEPTLLDRLAAHRTIANVPRKQLEWLAERGQVRTLEAGDVLTHAGGAVAGMYVILDGHFVIRRKSELLIAGKKETVLECIRINSGACAGGT